MQVKKIELLGEKTPYNAGGEVYDYLTDFCIWQSGENSNVSTH